MKSKDSLARARVGEGGGGGIYPVLRLVKEDNRVYPTTTPAQARNESELRARGVTDAMTLAMKYATPRIEAAIQAWDLQIEAGEKIGPGLLVWYIRNKVEPRTPARRGREDWLERRYQKGKVSSTPSRP